MIRKMIEKNRKKKLQKEINSLKTSETFSLNKTRIIVNALVNAGVIAEETVQDEMEADLLLEEIILRPGCNTVTFRDAEK